VTKSLVALKTGGRGFERAVLSVRNALETQVLGSLATLRGHGTPVAMEVNSTFACTIHVQQACGITVVHRIISNLTINLENLG
jgi:hypothetical protein